MIENFSFILALLAAIVFVIMLADKMRVAYPILLVISGLAISFIPDIPSVRIKPEMLFVLFFTTASL
ncbi:hypothetical protein [Flavobacterium sp. N1718]|uniref:hypothetical protein n=1 Tax=Flavobacterium sp. N1718 TaxID=2986822 RepID=UPI0029CAABFF|nr:hypothetical protein [Flavobacterium sp. N1718]